MIAERRLRRPVDHAFSYRIPEGWSIVPGQRVLAPLRGGRASASWWPSVRGRTRRLKALLGAGRSHAPGRDRAARASRGGSPPQSPLEARGRPCAALAPAVRTPARGRRVRRAAVDGTSAASRSGRAGRRGRALVTSDRHRTRCRASCWSAPAASGGCSRRGERARPRPRPGPGSSRRAARWTQRLGEDRAAARLDSGAADDDARAALARARARGARGSPSARARRCWRPLPPGGHARASIDEHEPAHQPPGPPRIHAREVVAGARPPRAAARPSSRRPRRAWRCGGGPAVGRVALRAAPSAAWPDGDRRRHARHPAPRGPHARAGPRDPGDAGRGPPRLPGREPPDLGAGLRRVRGDRALPGVRALRSRTRAPRPHARVSAVRRRRGRCPSCARTATAVGCRRSAGAPSGWSTPCAGGSRRRASPATTPRPRAAPAARPSARRAAGRRRRHRHPRAPSASSARPRSASPASSRRTSSSACPTSARPSGRSAFLWAAAERVRADGALVDPVPEPRRTTPSRRWRGQELGRLLRARADVPRASSGYPPFRRLAVDHRDAAGRGEQPSARRRGRGRAARRAGPHRLSAGGRAARSGRGASWSRASAELPASCSSARSGTFRGRAREPRYHGRGGGSGRMAVLKVRRYGDPVLRRRATRGRRRSRPRSARHGRRHDRDHVRRGRASGSPRRRWASPSGSWSSATRTSRRRAGARQPGHRRAAAASVTAEEGCLSHSRDLRPRDARRVGDAGGAATSRASRSRSARAACRPACSSTRWTTSTASCSSTAWSR